MSAIFGILYHNNQPAQADLKLMDTALAQQGSDGAGIWIQGRVGLGQRLMCFTPEDRFERQPLVSTDGRLTLVCDARLDNRPELMPALGISAAEARILPDSAFLMRAYEKWGEACLDHLLGGFVFMLWDGRTQRLFAARSPFGGRTLFYYASPQAMAFATMPKGLLALPFVPRRLNEQKVADFLVFQHAELHTTFYSDIYRLPPGHRLTVGQDGLQVRRYWQPDLGRELHFGRDEEYVEAFNELFERVIADQLRSLTPVGVMMSGGLDSASVAATAARLLQREGKRLATFTEVPRPGFDGPVIAGRYADETPFVQAIAQMHPNLDPHFIRADRSDPFEGLDAFFNSTEIPFRNVANRVWYEAILQAARQNEVRVLLNGAQGNLTISWNGSGLLAQLLQGGHWLRAWREAQGLARQGNAHSPLSALVRQGLLPLLPTPLWRAAKSLYGQRKYDAAQHWQAHSPIRPDFAAAQQVDQRARALGVNDQGRPTADTRTLRYETITNVDAASDMGAGYQAVFGIQQRAPLLDVRLIEFCFALPEEQYQRQGVTRWLIRRAMADRLPPVVLANRQRGLQAADWYERLSRGRGQIANELDRLEHSDLARRVLDVARLRRLLEQFPTTGWGDMQILSDYRTVLESGLMVGRYLLWFEAG